MKQYRSIMICLAALVAASTLTGCGRRKPIEAIPGAEAITEIDPSDDFRWAEALFAQAFDAMETGNTNAAIRVFTDAIEAPEHTEHRPLTFNMLVRFLMDMEMEAQARRHLDDMLAADPDVARGAFYDYHGYLARSARHDEVLTWTDALLRMELPEDMRVTTLRWRLDSLIARDDDETLPARIAEILDMTPQDQLAALAHESAQALLNRNRLQTLASVIDDLEARDPQPSRLRAVTAEHRVLLAIRQSRWHDAMSYFESAAEWLSDTELTRLFRALGGAAGRANQRAIMEQACELILNDYRHHARATDAAARLWLAPVREDKDVQGIVERLTTLMDKEVQPATLFALYAGYFYETINDADAVEKMLALGARLLPSLDTENDRGVMRTLMLDGCFVVENYDDALHMLKEGIPGRDQSWHDLAYSKVEAHKALQENRLNDAVGHFQKFMQALRDSPDEETADPSSGTVHTREMILGRNAKRIGDILAEAGEAQGAREAYAQARAYYREAIETLDEPTSPSSMLAQAEMDDIPEL